jgi:hypothetical protein
MQYAMNFKDETSIQSPKKDEKIDDFNIFEAKCPSKKKIDLNMLSKYNQKNIGEKKAETSKR